MRRISFRIGTLPPEDKETQNEIFFFEFPLLLNEVAEAISRWLATYNAEPDKFVKFVARYDETVSDSRVATYVKPDN